VKAQAYSTNINFLKDKIMKVLKSKREGNTYKLEIEAPIEKINSAMDVAFNKVVKHANIPGFRPGKVTRAIFEQHYGKGPIIQEALGTVINDCYFDAIKELDLHVIDSPKNIDLDDYKDNQPIKFRCEVDVKPIIKLGKYKGFKAKKEATTVSDEDLDNYIKGILDRYADFVLAERPVQKEDFLRLNIKAIIDGQQYDKWSRDEMGYMVGSKIYGEDFDKEVIGLEKDAKKDFSVNLAEDFMVKDIAGKKVDFSIEIKEIKEKKLPELTDEFIQKLSQDKTVDEFKANIRKSLEEQKKHNSEEKLKTDLMTQVIDDIKVEIPQIMIDKEIDNTLRYFDSTLRRSGSNLENYLQLTKKPIDEMRKELSSEAEKRVKTYLALEAIAEKEAFEVTEPEMDEEVKKWKIPNMGSFEEFKLKTKEYELENLKLVIKERKVYDFLIAQAKIS
jgi:trigger factor